jgi:hypothetical protein
MLQPLERTQRSQAPLVVIRASERCTEPTLLVCRYHVLVKPL